MATERIRIKVEATADTSQASAELKRLAAQAAALNKSMASANALPAGVNGRMFRNLESDMDRFSETLKRGTINGRDFAHGVRNVNELAAHQARVFNSQWKPAMDNMSNGLRHGTLMMGHASAETVSYGQKMAALNTLVKAHSTHIVNMGKNLQWAGRQITVGFGVPLALAVVGATREFRKLDEQLVRFRKVFNENLGTPVDEATVKVVALADKLVQSLGRARTETVETAAAFAQMGKTIEEVQFLTEQTMRISTLGEVDISTSIDLVRAYAANWNLTGAELEKSVNLLNAIENNTSLTTAAMAHALPQIIPLFTQWNLKLGEGEAIIAGMNERLGSAAESVNALKVIVPRIFDPTGEAFEKFDRVFKDVGINLSGIIANNENDLIGMLSELGRIAATSNLNLKELSESFGNLLGSRQQGRALTALISTFEGLNGEANDFTRAMGVIGNDFENAISAQSEINAQLESSSGQFRKMVEEIKMYVQTIGGELQPILNGFLKGIKSVLAWFTNLSDGTKKFIGTIFVFGAAMGGAMMALGIFVNLLGSTLRAITNLFPSMALFTTKEMAQQKATDALSASIQNLTATYERLAIAQTNAHMTALPNYAHINGKFATGGRIPKDKPKIALMGHANQGPGIDSSDGKAQLKGVSKSRGIAGSAAMLAFLASSQMSSDSTSGHIMNMVASMAMMTMVGGPAIKALKNWHKEVGGLSGMIKPAVDGVKKLAMAVGTGLKTGGIKGAAAGLTGVLGASTVALGALGIAIGAGVVAWKFYKNAVEKAKAEQFSFNESLQTTLDFVGAEMPEFQGEVPDSVKKNEQMQKFVEANEKLLIQLRELKKEGDTQGINDLLQKFVTSLQAAGVAREGIKTFLKMLQEEAEIIIPVTLDFEVENIAELREIDERQLERYAKSLKGLNPNSPAAKGITNSMSEYMLGIFKVDPDSFFQQLEELKDKMTGPEYRKLIQDVMRKLSDAGFGEFETTHVSENQEQAYAALISSMEEQDVLLNKAKADALRRAILFERNRQAAERALREGRVADAEEHYRIMEGIIAEGEKGLQIADDASKKALEVVVHKGKQVNAQMEEWASAISSSISTLRNNLDSYVKDIISLAKQSQKEYFEKERENLKKNQEAVEDLDKARHDAYKADLARRRKLSDDQATHTSLELAVARGDLEQAAQIRAKMAGEHLDTEEEKMDAMFEARAKARQDEAEAQEEALAEREEAAEKSLQKELEALTKTTPKNKAEWDQRMKDINAILKKHGVTINAEIQDIMTNGWKKSVQDWKDALVEDQKWDKIGETVGEALGRGMFDSLEEALGGFEAALMGGVDLSEVESLLEALGITGNYVAPDGISEHTYKGSADAAERNNQPPPPPPPAYQLVKTPTGYDVKKDGQKVDSIVTNQELGITSLGKVFDSKTGHPWPNAANQKKYHSGGLVEGMGEVPAILEAGEFVMKKDAVARLGLGNLKGLNEGMGAGPDGYSPLSGLFNAIAKSMIGPGLLTKLLKVLMEKLGTPAGTPTGGTTSTANRRGWTLPVPGGKLISKFGDARDGGARKHMGWDLGQERGAPVVAARDGKVVKSGIGGGYFGKRIWMYSPDVKLFHAYAHMNSLGASENASVKGGQQIGTIGNTGAPWSVPHLHWSANPSTTSNERSSINPDNLLSLMKGGKISHDNTIANLHKGEMVLRRPVSKNLEAAVGNMAAGAGAGDVHIHIGSFHGTEDNVDLLANKVITKIEQSQRRTGMRRTVG